MISRELSDGGSRSPRLLYIYVYCNLGGVTSVIKQRAKQLVPLGYEIDAVFQVDYGGGAELLSHGLTLVEISSDPVGAAEKLIDENEYDAVTVIDMPDVARDLEARGVRPLYYEIHTPMDDVLLSNDPAVLGNMDRIVVPSPWSKRWICRHFPGLPSERVVACGNIVDPSVFREPAELAENPDRPIIWVGKFGDYKNWRLAFEILATYLTRNPDRHGYFVTGGRLTDTAMDEFLAMILDRQLGSRFSWLHDLENAEMAPLYREIARRGGALLSCSETESFCMVIHEAGRCGLPSVVTPAGAVADFISHGENGLSILPDCESGVAALELITEDEELRRRVLNGLAQTLRDYDPGPLISDYLSALKVDG